MRNIGKTQASAGIIATQLKEGKQVGYVGSRPFAILRILKEQHGLNVVAREVYGPRLGHPFGDAVIDTSETPLFNLVLEPSNLTLQDRIDRIKAITFDVEKKKRELNRFVDQSIGGMYLMNWLSFTGNLPITSDGYFVYPSIH